MSERERFPWGAVLVGLLVLTILGAGVGTPMLVKSRRETRYRSITSNLWTLCTAESDFLLNDRDGNRVIDFWTGDAAGLYTIRSARDGSEIRLLDPALARADARPILPFGPTPESKADYFFQALDRDNNYLGEGIYRVDTDGSGRKVHNLDRFGFCAFPELLEAGRPIFVVNEIHTVFHRMDGKLHFNWPADMELKYTYSRFDY